MTSCASSSFTLSVSAPRCITAAGVAWVHRKGVATGDSDQTFVQTRPCHEENSTTEGTENTEIKMEKNFNEKRRAFLLPVTG